MRFKESMLLMPAIYQATKSNWTELFVCLFVFNIVFKKNLWSYHDGASL